MKKLNLKNLMLNADDLLQRERLKSIFGGENGYPPPPGGGDNCVTTCLGSGQCAAEYGNFWWCSPKSCANGSTVWQCQPGP